MKVESLLWPARFPDHVVRRMETVTLGPEQAAAQFQQVPQPPGGSVWKLEDLTRTCPKPTGGYWFQVWDPSFKKTTSGSFTVGIVCCYQPKKLILVDLFRQRIDFPGMQAGMRAMAAAYPQSKGQMIVEAKASGDALLSSLARELPGMRGVTPTTDKIARAHAAQGFFFAGGQLFIVEGVPWAADLRSELVRFPKAANDDQADCVAMAIEHISDKGIYKGTGDKWDPSKWGL